MMRDPSGADEAAVRKLLGEEREETLARIRSIQEDFDAIVTASHHANADDEHDPEGSTIAYERAQVAALLAAAELHLSDLECALARLSDRQYWLCERCHAPISADRLAALPAGRTCFECASRS
jgi:RNA polymerase-binding transcription factor DksA